MKDFIFKKGLINMNISEFIGVLGGATALATGLATFFTKIILKNVSIEWQKQANLEIEEFRSKLNEKTDQLKKILSNSSDVHSLAQNKRLEAVNILWQNVIKIRNLNKSATFFYLIFKPKEYNKKLDNNINNEILATTPNIEELSSKTNEIMADVEIYRPFLNEYLWGLFSIYNSFSSRLTYKLKENSKKKNINIWYKDDGLDYLIKAVFNSEELDLIEFDSPNSIKIVIDKMEEKIISECAKIVSGDFAMKKSINQSRKLKEALIRVEDLDFINKK